jgi:acyl dehydratase
MGRRKMEATGSRKKYWEDLNEGEPLPCRPVTFERSDIVFFGKKFDPLPFHTDEAAAGGSIFGGLVASSLHTLAACTRVVVEAQGDVAILSGIGLDAVRLFNPVRPGDVLTVDARWSDLRRSRTKPDRGLAGIRCTVSNQKGEPVVEYGYRYLVACRDVA